MNTYIPHHKTRQHIAGISLVEVFVSMAIALILVGGIIEIYLNSKRTFQLNESLAALNENGRFLMTEVMHNIRMAGYRTPPDASLQVKYPALEEVFSGANVFLSATHNDGTNGSDSLTVRYQGSGSGAGTPDGSIRDCLNGGVDANQMATNIYSITANNQLQCQAINTTTNPDSDTTDVLLNNVENMQVLLGEDTDGDLIANRYVPANYAGLDTNNVVALKLAFLLRSNEEIMQQDDTRSYNLLGTVYDPPNDKRLRKIFETTIQLRNRDSSDGG